MSILNKGGGKGRAVYRGRLETRHREFVVVTATAVWSAIAFIAPVAAQNWPTKSIRVIVPLSASSATNLVPRTVFEQGSKQVGQNIAIENRPGDGGALSTLPTRQGVGLKK